MTKGLLAGLCVLAVASVAMAPSVRAESRAQRLDRIIAETSAQCAALDRQFIAETEDTSPHKAGQPYGYGPVLNEDRQCHALLQSLYSASSDEAEADYRRFQRQEAMGRQLRSSDSGYQPAPSPQMQLPDMPPPAPYVPFDPGYDRRPTPTVTCVGQVMVAGPPDQAAACAGP